MSLPVQRSVGLGVPLPVMKMPSSKALFLRVRPSKFKITVGVFAAGDASSGASTAKQAVEAGLLAFEAGNPQEALELFLQAQRLDPNEEEARAALYNAACAYTKLRRWPEAANAVVAAVNDYNLKLSVAAADPDLARLRESREWTAALERAAGGISNEAFVKLRSEAKAPFRLTRIIFVGGLSAGALVGLIIGGVQLAAAVRGGEGAPDLTETLRNCGINAASLAALALLLWRDLGSQRRDEEIVQREEALAQLQVALGPSRVVPLAAFRGAARPVILAGTKKQVARMLKESKPYQPELRERGVSVVPVVVSGGLEDGDKEEGGGEVRGSESVQVDSAAELRWLKAEFSGAGAGEGGAASGGKGFGSSAPKSTPAATAATAGEAVVKQDRRWELQPAGLAEWEGWVKRQVKSAGNVSAGVYVQIQLDGSVRASGVGTPPWKQFVDDIPELDSLRTRLTDGAGMS